MVAFLALLKALGTREWRRTFSRRGLAGGWAPVMVLLALAPVAEQTFGLFNLAQERLSFGETGYALQILGGYLLLWFVLPCLLMAANRGAALLEHVRHWPLHPGVRRGLRLFELLLSPGFWLPAALQPLIFIHLLAASPATGTARLLWVLYCAASLSWSFTLAVVWERLRLGTLNRLPVLVGLAAIATAFWWGRTAGLSLADLWRELGTGLLLGDWTWWRPLLAAAASALVLSWFLDRADLPQKRSKQQQPRRPPGWLTWLTARLPLRIRLSLAWAPAYQHLPEWPPLLIIVVGFVAFVLTETAPPLEALLFAPSLLVLFWWRVAVNCLLLGGLGGLRRIGLWPVTGRDLLLSHHFILLICYLAVLLPCLAALGWRQGLLIALTSCAAGCAGFQILLLWAGAVDLTKPVARLHQEGLPLVRILAVAACGLLWLALLTNLARQGVALSLTLLFGVNIMLLTLYLIQIKSLGRYLENRLIRFLGG